MKYYYADAQNKIVGPVSLDELRALVIAGGLKSDPMVVPEGGSDWKPLSAFVGPGNSGPMPDSNQRRFSNQVQGGGPLPFSRTVLGDFVTTALKNITGWLNEGFIERSLIFDRNAGHYAVLSGGALGLIYCIFIAIKHNQLAPMLVGVGFVVALAIAQFAAMGFLGAGESLIANTPHRISSRAFLECTGLLFLFAGMGVLVSGLWTGIQIGGMNALLPIIPAVIFSVFLVYAAAIAFNPQTVNISIGSGTSGQEAVGILGFFLKVALKLLPIGFLFIGLGANLVIILSFWQRDLFSQFAPGFGFMADYSGLAMVLFACLLPFVGYIFFLMGNLGLEIIRSILSLTGKQEQ
jgi:hypothetical protein